MWEPAGAAALSIFLTVALFLSVYAASYLIVSMLLKTVRTIKKIINQHKTN